MEKVFKLGDEIEYIAKGNVIPEGCIGVITHICEDSTSPMVMARFAGMCSSPLYAAYRNIRLARPQSLEDVLRILKEHDTHIC